MTSSSVSHMIGRVALVLRALSTFEPSGVSTTNLARQVALPRPTVHRLLSTMLDEGMVDRDTTTGYWHVGPEMYLLGASAATRYDASRDGRDMVEQLSQATGESAFFSARRGDETVCIVSRDGSFPLRSHVLHEGIRLPLGVASAGLVILAHLPDRDIDAYLARTDLARQWGPSHAGIHVRARIAETRSAGYATNPGLLVEGSWGMAAAVFDASGNPAWAISLTGVDSRFRDDRRPELGERLLDHAHRLSQRIQARPSR